jgi:hypothetical protein
LEDFLFAREICLYSFCRAFYAASSERKIKVLSLSWVEIHPKYESLSTIFIRWKVTLLCTFSHFECERNHQYGWIEICFYNFCSTFHDTSFEKKPEVLAFVCAEIYTKQFMLLTFQNMVFNILTIKLSVLHEIQIFFYENDQQKKLYKVW